MITNATSLEEHVAGLVLARGNSSELPRKNIRILNGIPLLAWALRPMKDYKRFDSLWVATDDNDIAEVASNWGASIFWRSPSTSQDRATSVEAVQEFLSYHPGGNTKALNFDPAKRPRRQDWPGELVESGHFYFVRRYLVMSGMLQGRRCGYVELPAELCIEIDSEFDWMMAEHQVKFFGYYGDYGTS
ncbi:CMP-sialic acid synthase isoform X6 [Tachypleus tridentatus]|uniref:CMP-sialic acid synthase isoform X6 n=1 Tax=Tachypleus tridentatus TaxID=6853 RepID=UPI003FD14FB6